MTKKEKSPIKRINLALPDSLFDQVVEVAADKDTTVADIIRRFAKLGVRVDKAEENGGGLVKKDGDKETRLIII